MGVMALDVTETTFQSAVIDRSHQVPVVVDFWAEWCGPCRQLGPMIERAVEARAGKLELVKIDTDANQELARAFNIQSIPAVKAFKDGKLANEFIGALPPAQIEQFLDSLVPSEVDELIALGDEASLRRAVKLDPKKPEAAVALAKLLLKRGHSADALEVVRNASGSFAADGMAARIELTDAGAPDLSAAFAKLDAGQDEDALDLLLTELPSASEAKDAIRRIVVGVLDELGPESELARSSRRRLAAALY
jgi:putative thioredoxin